MLVAVGAVIALAGCTSTSTPVATTTPTPIPSSSPSATTVGGLGDTASNPDQPTYICADASQGSTGVIAAYLTIAGPDVNKAETYCNYLNGYSSWSNVLEIPANDRAALTASNGCWLALGQDTVRVYTALPNGTDANTLQLCSAIGVQ
jgi:hypothetical protein